MGGGCRRGAGVSRTIMTLASYSVHTDLVIGIVVIQHDTTSSIARALRGIVSVSSRLVCATNTSMAIHSTWMPIAETRQHRRLKRVNGSARLT